VKAFRYIVLNGFGDNDVAGDGFVETLEVEPGTTYDQDGTATILVSK
jgi:hypothetical protein